jgi:hypothetical protein
MTGDRAVEARWVHNPEVVGSNPTPPTYLALTIEGLRF